MKHIDEIIDLILADAEDIENPDKVSRIHSAFTEVRIRLNYIMLEIRESERNERSNNGS